MAGNKSLTGLFNIGGKPWTVPLQGAGSLTNLYEPGSKGGQIDVVRDYMWTLSPPAIKTTAPYVILKEYSVNEGMIKRSLFHYWNGVKQAVKETGGMSQDSMEVYGELFPKDKPTKFSYILPYFSEINFEVNTPEWTQLDNLEAIGNMGKGIANAAYEGAGDYLQDVVTKGGTAIGVGMATIGGYPKIGIMDRPKLWNSHSPRSINIKFSLFNTVNADDWKHNRDLCTLLVNQNLYNKRDLLTSLPPVFYEILIPGQHYSYASCVTNITISNRGNMRAMKLEGAGADTLPTAIVPDAYEVSITLTDMLIPSQNQFQQINSNTVYTRLIKN